MGILFKDIIVIGEGVWVPSQDFVGYDVDGPSKVEEHKDNLVKG